MTTLLTLPPVPDRRIVGHWLAGNTRTPNIDAAGRNAPSGSTGSGWRRSIRREVGLTNAANNSVTVPASTVINDMPEMSIALWMSVSALALVSIAQKNSAPTTANGAWDFRLDASGSLIYRKSYSSTIQQVASQSSAVKTRSGWQHIVLSSKNSSLASDVRFYVDGVEVGYSTQTNGSGTRRTDVTRAILFASTISAGIAYRDIRLFNVALSPADVAAMYRRKRTPLLLSPASMWRWWWAAGGNSVVGA